MNPITFLIGIACAVLWVLARNAQSRYEQLREIKHHEIAPLVESVAAVASEIGAGSFQELVEVSGEIICQNPLTAPGSKTPCIHYEVWVERVFDEQVESTDANGKTHTRIVTRSEELTRHADSIPFDLADATGSLRVIPAGAQYEGLTASQSVFVPVEALPGGRSHNNNSKNARDRLTFPWPWLPVLAPHAHKTTVGYRCHERLLPLDVEHLVVIGEVSDVRGQVSIRRDNQPLIISTRSRETLETNARRKARWLRWGAQASAVATLIAFVWGWLK